jgi:hypothetical protein
MNPWHDNYKTILWMTSLSNYLQVLAKAKVVVGHITLHNYTYDNATTETTLYVLLLHQPGN